MSSAALINVSTTRMYIILAAGAAQCASVAQLIEDTRAANGAD